jgi:CRISPR-associated protein Csh1
MINQFAELGSFYRQQEGIGTSPEDRLAQFAQDPSQKFRTRTVLLLVFSDGGFEEVQVEQYDAHRKLDYLYRAGPSQGCDPTPTTKLPPAKKGDENEFDDNIRKKLIRLAKSVADAYAGANEHPGWECTALKLIQSQLEAAGRRDGADTQLREKMVGCIKQCHPADSMEAAILTIAWRGNTLQRVGDFRAFQRSLIRHGEQAASSKRTAKSEVKGIGQCSICGKQETEVFGLLKIFHPPLYSTDKPGSVSGGFDQAFAWRNFPACRECCERVDFAGERVKKQLTFDYYSSFKYLFLPLPLRPQPTLAFQLLDRLVSFRLNQHAQKRLTSAEDELFYVVAEMEDNLLQVDLLFYQPDPQSFRPALYVSGLLPSHFRSLFQAKDRVDQHPWLQPPSPKSFAEGQFTFGSMNRVFPHAHGGSKFDDDFLAATRAALERRRFPISKLLQCGMRWVRQDYFDGKAWSSRLAELFRTITFFDELTNTRHEGDSAMELDYGMTPQAERVRSVLQNASGKLRTEAPAQAVFLVGGMLQPH